MAQRKRTSAQKTIDLVEIETLSLRGHSAREIAEILSQSESRDYTLSRQQVQYDIDKLDEIWQAEAIAEIDKAKRRVLAEIKDLQHEYWSAWKRSQEDAESEITKMQGTDPAKPGKLEKQQKREGQSGNPAFLRGVEWCINKRCEILGINAPVKSELTGKDGEPLIPKVDNERFDRAISSLADAVRESILGTGAKSDGELGSAK